MYICPICKSKLIKENNTYKCVNNHSFDISTNGYVNLLVSNKKTKIHGDNKLMISARRRFLMLNHYFLIVNKLKSIINSLKSTGIIIDCGCGEGYYTGALSEKLRENYRIFGLDVSKEGVKAAAKKYKNIPFSVSSINEMPFNDNTADFIISLFAPLSENEFSRVLKKDGYLITVSPGKKHLFGLKKELYDTPYENPPSTFHPSLLNKISETEEVSEMILNSNEEIRDLFTMTPYYYNTGVSGKDKIETLNYLKTEIEFTFCVFKNNK